MSLLGNCDQLTGWLSREQAATSVKKVFIDYARFLTAILSRLHSF
jgi:hypothetical protein